MTRTGVQLENGYTRIAQPLLEALALAPFSASQLTLVLYLIRETYGWNRKDAPVGLTAAAKGTGLSRSSVGAALEALVREGVLRMVSEPTFRTPAVYRLQKNPRRWGAFACSPPSLASPNPVSGQPDSPAGGTVRQAPPGVSGQPDSTVPVDRTVQPPQPLGESGSGEAKDRIDNDRHPPPLHPCAPAEELERLRRYLGGGGQAVDLMDRSAAHPRTWAAGIYGLYGPAGVDADVAFHGIPPDDRPQILAAALMRYASEGHVYEGRFFRGFVIGVRNERERASSRNGRPAAEDRRGAAAAGHREAGELDHLGA